MATAIDEEVPAALDALAVKAAQVMGLELAAVDLLDVGTGPMVFDVFSSPGLKELEHATGKDLAMPIIARAEELAGLTTRRPARKRKRK